MSHPSAQFDDSESACFPTWLSPALSGAGEAAASSAVTQGAEPDPTQALAFFATLFPTSQGESIHFRGVPEPKDGRHPQNLHYALDEHFRDNVRGFLDWCDVDRRAAFFLPGIVKGGGTGKADVLSLPAVLVDFDKGNPDENLKAAEAFLGPATVVVESGGAVEDRPKLHAYWRLSTPATGAECAQLCHVRELLAHKFGGDPAFKQPAQVIRVPGSIHFKGAPKLVQLRTIRPEAVYTLADIQAKIAPPANHGDNTGVVNIFDFNNVDTRQDGVERALTQPTHEGGVDDMTRFEAAGKAIGHFIRMVREGRMDEAGAWRAACEWNAATLVPPWDEARLRGDFNRLLRADIESRGPFVPPRQVVGTHATGGSVRNWNIKRFAGPAPERRWLVEGLIPQGTAGLLAAVGDAGKSMLALQLALHVGTAAPLDPSAVMDLSAPKFFGQPVIGRGAAVILTAEDDADEVHRRVAALDRSNLRAGDPKVYVRPMISDGGPRAILCDGPAGPQPTEFWRELRADLLSIPDLRLLAIDPLSHFAAVSLDKDNRAGAALMSMLGELAATSGAAIMLVHHMAKGTIPTSLTDARAAIRGAGSLVDNGRWALALWEAEPDAARKALKPLGQEGRAAQAGIVYFGGLAKGNAPGAKVLRTMVRNTGNGLLEDVTEQLIAAHPKQAETDAAAFAALRAHRWKDERFAFTAGTQGLWKAWHPIFVAAGVRVTRKEVESLFERGLQQKQITMSSQRKGGYAVFEVVID